jgi:N-acetylneuraminic acid mutarotase
VWCPGPQLLQPIGHPALVSDGKRLYVIGGSDTTGKALSTVYRLDSPSSTWQLGVPLGATGTGEPSAGFPRAEGAAAWVGNGIIYAGGIDEHGQVQPDIWTFDRTRWTRSGTLQPARRQLAAATTGGTVWFIGGTTDAADSKSETPVAAVDVIPAVTQIPRAAFGRVDRAAAVAFGKRICVIGGIRSAGSDPVRAVDCQPSLSITGLGSPRAGAGAAVVNGKIYVIGGWNSSNHGGQKTVEVLDIHSVQ